MGNIRLIAVGGYNEMGRNMTAVEVDGKCVIMDMGLRLDRIQIHEDVDTEKMHSLDLIKMGAIPDDTVLNGNVKNVKAIVSTHGHLDHVGAIPKLAHRYDAPIISTPYTTEIIRELIKKERKFGVENKLVPLGAGESMELGNGLSLEFVRTTHSIIQTVFIVLHTPYGAVFYANDFKLDRTPTLEEKPDFRRLKQLGKEGVALMLAESTNSGNSGKTPSEKIAKDMVQDVLLGTEESSAGVIVTTFSSHIARINALIETALKMDRIPVLLGNSMKRYVVTANKMGLIKFPENLEVYSTGKAIQNAFTRINAEGRENYLPIITGHQGEPGAVLTRVSNEEFKYRIEKGDKVVFSANKIPNPMTLANRYALETKLKMQGARIYENVHVSGHACREDHWELLRMLNPQHVIPSHGNLAMHINYVEMAEEAGYELGYNTHIIRNGEEVLLEV
ncbi:MAG: RNase J family beta-CASP ribonuclease [Methermicoccaceae archaeon]